MLKYLFFLLAGLGIALLGTTPGQAYYDAPWCAVYTIGNGSVTERCEFASVEACQREIVSGNRGFCNLNPRAPYLSRRARRPQ